MIMERHKHILFIFNREFVNEMSIVSDEYPWSKLATRVRNVLCSWLY